MLRTFLAAALIALCGSAFADETSGENLFQKGLAAYQNKQYGEARDHFRQLIEANTVSAPLLHNLALAHFQLNEAPLALALWRKALTLDPGFRPARQGRDFIEAQLQVRGFERDRVREWIRSTLETVSFFESLWVLALLLAASGWLWIRYWAERRAALEEERARPALPVTAMTLGVLLLIVVLLSVLKLQLSLSTRATVIAAQVSALSLPAEDGVGLFELRGGSEVKVRRRQDGWIQIQNPEGASGWLRDTDLFITAGR